MDGGREGAPPMTDFGGGMGGERSTTAAAAASNESGAKSKTTLLAGRYVDDKGTPLGLGAAAAPVDGGVKAARPSRPRSVFPKGRISGCRCGWY